MECYIKSLKGKYSESHKASNKTIQFAKWAKCYLKKNGEEDVENEDQSEEEDAEESEDAYEEVSEEESKEESKEEEWMYDES